jgi:uncharacterized OsmC-like protein
MSVDYWVVAGAGSLRPTGDGVVAFPHRWTDGGVAVKAEFTGAHLLHLATAGCVLNDVYREAAALGLDLDGVRVSASGEFDPTSWVSSGIVYSVELESPAAPDQVARLLELVDAMAEIPRTIRAGAPVARTAAEPGDGTAPA